MKIIGSVKEDLDTEKRISITPETVKKIINLNCSISLEKNYGSHIGISDKEYELNGAILHNSAKEVLEKSDITLMVNCLKNEKIESIKKQSILIGQFDPDLNNLRS